jgi:hypothetical protein
MKKKILFVLTLLALTSCMGRKPFQPPPPEFKQWVKTGISEGIVKATMLECGFSNPFGNALMDDNNYAEAQNCMMRKGFVHTSGFNICKGNKNLHACKSLPTR